eukprot:SAG25_NODE_5759_length_623_cov_1.568702_1_plen_61_part_10
MLSFEATNASLTSFAEPTTLYATNTSFVTQARVHMFECPDWFSLRDTSTNAQKYVLITSEP